jgi:hypothetical protein
VSRSGRDRKRKYKLAVLSVSDEGLSAACLPEHIARLLPELDTVKEFFQDDHTDLLPFNVHPWKDRAAFALKK